MYSESACRHFNPTMHSCVEQCVPLREKPCIRDTENCLAFLSQRTFFLVAVFSHFNTLVSGSKACMQSVINNCDATYKTATQTSIDTTYAYFDTVSNLCQQGESLLYVFVCICLYHINVLFSSCRLYRIRQKSANGSRYPTLTTDS